MANSRLEKTKMFAEQLRSNKDTVGLADFIEDFTCGLQYSLTDALDSEMYELLNDMPNDLIDEGGAVIYRLMRVLVKLKRGFSRIGV